ncbi:thioredoxin TrxA [Paratissierella segnis]|jgi:thioredoxin 1|uniref:Thioredoxin n=1 Tax=Paratissierella segnis TaxID=2763679 RepID=A0A926EWC2_9FIRM|nr:thioredoxin [Paratissierella segnis]MBC8589523.1 thioredoxin [Paratissierella segnis]
MIELNKENFEQEVLKSEGYVLVDYWSPSCEPCKALMPHVHEYENTYGDKIKFASLDITIARRLAISQKVLGLPVIAIYKDGEKIDSVVADDANPKSVEGMLKKYY